MHEGLGALVARLWGPGDERDSPVVVTTGRLPATHRLVEEYAVVPSLRRPRYLLPVGGRQAVTAALGDHLSATGPRSRAAARALALAWASGTGPGLFRDRLRVGLDRRVPAHDRPRWLLLDRLALELDAPGLVAVVPVRRATPNAKPTARLFTREGTACGYLKVGWSPATRALVDNETRTLLALGGTAGVVEVPTVAAAGRWRGRRSFHVARPLPARLTAWDGAPRASCGPLLDVAARGDVRDVRLDASPWTRSVLDRLEPAEAGVPVETAALRATLGRVLGGPDGRAVLTFGRWHGDWVPWNLGRLGNRRMVWDWEYSADAAPLGFDLLHWHFQTRLAHPDATVAVAVDAAWAARHDLLALGVPREHHDLLVRLYVLEILTRAVWLAGHGSGWNPKLQPGLLAAAAGCAA
ncbi:hypothetical protein GCM10023340_04200 [Nocardioides marinquilinus]|uniref:Aminoglycoside phosphotransferase domain-containing protein n=1 Tax=Nocardioides marinquilinus TaxID=1210400 RepID=A0ABP9P7V7_9ACTN